MHYALCNMCVCKQAIGPQAPAHPGGAANYHGQLGLGHTEDRDWPELLRAPPWGGDAVTAVACGRDHTAVVAGPPSAHLAFLKLRFACSVFSFFSENFYIIPDCAVALWFCFFFSKENQALLRPVILGEFENKLVIIS